MTRCGIPWDRSIVANFENGRRSGISAEELLTLAHVFNVAPVHLLVPVDDSDMPYQVAPEVVYRAGVVRQWIRGFFPLPSEDRRLYFSEVPEQEWVPPGGLPHIPGGVLTEHELERDMAERDLSGDIRHEE